MLNLCLVHLVNVMLLFLIMIIELYCVKSLGIRVINVPEKSIIIVCCGVDSN